ncbi:hypothetical protein BJ965_007071 [Streptomyces luteogriseus]|uniref:Uncharacterized protein n=1 Tax=Streptomyces luteogriseus TaxID=68233 RepID=A0A7W7DUJ1_9ACTN|nr:hypothetical protein [Streptomyces luteogriseus]
MTVDLEGDLEGLVAHQLGDVGDGNAVREAVGGDLPAGRRPNSRLAQAGAAGDSTVRLSVGGCGRILADLMLILLTHRQAGVSGSFFPASALV